LWQDYVEYFQFRSKLIEEEHAAKRASLRKEEIRKEQAKVAAVVRSKHEHHGPNLYVCSCIIVLICASVVHVLTVTQGTIGMDFRWKGIFFEDTNRGKTQQNRVDTPQSRNISYGWLHSVTSKCTTRTISSSKQQYEKKIKVLQIVH